MDSLPKKERMCHRANMDKCCRDLVVSGACERWKEIYGNDPQKNAVFSLGWNCIDDHMFFLALQNGLQQDRIIASTDKVANEVKTGRDENVAVGAMLVQRARLAVKEAIGEAVPALTNGASQPLALPKN